MSAFVHVSTMQITSGAYRVQATRRWSILGSRLRALKYRIENLGCAGRCWRGSSYVTWCGDWATGKGWFPSASDWDWDGVVDWDCTSSVADAAWALSSITWLGMVVDAAVRLDGLLVAVGGCNTQSLGLVQGSSFQFVCKETLSHSPSNLCSRGYVSDLLR